MDINAHRMHVYDTVNFPATTGYTCGGCGWWVRNGQPHYCSRSNFFPFSQPVVVDNSEKLDKIIDLLEKLLEDKK